MMDEADAEPVVNVLATIVTSSQAFEVTDLGTLQAREGIRVCNQIPGFVQREDLFVEPLGEDGRVSLQMRVQLFQPCDILVAETQKCLACRNRVIVKLKFMRHVRDIKVLNLHIITSIVWRRPTLQSHCDVLICSC
tara:strand:- start:19711 stop:20118 length:408 start_codon:yes stop_codon:yes gene_type:complete